MNSSMTGIRVLYIQQKRLISTSPALCKKGIAQWRLKRGMGPCGNEYGPLTEIPDWSYADGRPAPPTMSAKDRAQRQIEMCERIVQLTKEVKFARDNYARKQREQADIKQQLLSQKLRPKIHNQ